MRLYPIYEYCMDNSIPITAHCENGGIPGLDDYYHLAHPRYWAMVLENFPGLKLNLAHNDQTCLRAATHRQAGSSWQPLIADLIMRYSNVYTDCSLSHGDDVHAPEIFQEHQANAGYPQNAGQATLWY